MGQELSTGGFQSECTSPDRQILDYHYEEDVDSTTRSSNSESEEFFTPMSGNRSVVPDNTVIIFDWDDTLLCSTAINTSTWTLKELRDLELAAESALHTAMSLGETLIVTNGNATWVQDSARRFLPGLLPTLAKVQCVSARALYEHVYPGDPFMWKKAAFRHLLTQERHIPQTTGVNLVALGDQTPEIEAAHHVGKFIGGLSTVKTVKLKEAPSIQEIIGQLGKVEQELSRLVVESVTSRRTLARKKAAANMDHVVSQAVGWGFVNKDEDSSSWKFPSSLAFKDLWPLFS